MSKYTTEVRFICEDAADLEESLGFDSIEDKPDPSNPGTYIPGILSKAAEKIFDFPFPIFDEAYRLPLEKKILRHYYTREICEETVGLWKLRLSDRLNIIMPYYNQMYTSELIKFNPLYDVELSRTHTGEKGSEENTTSTNTNTSVATGDKTRHGEAETNGESSSVNSTDSHTVREDKSNGSSANFSANEQIGEKSREEERKDVTDSNRNATGSTNGGTITDEISTNKDNSERWDKYSDTPQGAVTGLMSDEYLTNARNVKDTKDNSVAAHGDTSVRQNTENTESGNEISAGNSNVKETDRNSENTSDVSNVTNETNGDEKVSGTSSNIGQNAEKSSVNNTETSSDVRNDTGSLTGKNTISGTESYTEFVLGKQGSGSYSKMLMEFRQTFLNIDAMVLEELSDLFFGLW